MEKFELPILEQKTINKPDFNLDIKINGIDRASHTFYNTRKVSVEGVIDEAKT